MTLLRYHVYTKGRTYPASIEAHSWSDANAQARSEYGNDVTSVVCWAPPPPPDPPACAEDDDRHDSEVIGDRALLVLILQRLSDDIGHPHHMESTARDLLPLIRENCERYARSLGRNGKR